MKWKDSGIQCVPRIVVSFCKMEDWGKKVRHANIDGNVPVKKGKINDVGKGEDNYSSKILEEETENRNKRTDEKSYV